MKAVACGCLLTAQRHGRIVSCGCYRKERMFTARLTHGNARGIKGGSPEYVAWQRMKQRCYYPGERQFANYGGRGITVCPEWRESFLAFLADVGKRPSAKHSLDRIDTSGHYEPSNVRWATHREQSLNKRNNRLLTFMGETHPLREWARLRGISVPALENRLNAYGWTVERALTQPVGPSRQRKH
ncbi:MAG: hypothetical protein V4792_07990 [Pseudomonadota bacterium]